MNQNEKNKKLVLKQENKEESKINKKREDYGRKKLLSKIKKLSKLSKSYSNIKSDELMEKVITTKNDNYYMKSNVKIVDDINYKKKLKQAKEVKDLENIFKKWNQDKIIYNLYNDLNKSYELFDKQNLKENKKESSKEKNKKKKLEERKKMLKKIREIKLEKEKEKEKQIQTSEIDLKKLEKKMKKELDMISAKQNLIYDNNNSNFIKKLELILIVRQFIKEEIILNNNDNNSNLISPEDAINYKENDIITFLGFLGQELSLQNNEIYIEEEPTYEFLRDITLKTITSNLANHNFYTINIKSDDLKEKFQENFEYWLSYLNNIKLRISIACNVSQSNIYFFGHNFSTFEVNLILYKQKVELEKFLNNFDINITESTLLNNIILSPNIFDSNFNKKEVDWPTENLKRGGTKYYPPFGWVGMALKIKERYGKDDIWLGKKNKEGEWPVAYYGVGKGNNVLKDLLSILDESFKDYSENSKKDKETPKKIHLFKKISDAEKQAEKIKIRNSNLIIQFAFMTRVNPDKLKDFDSFPSSFKLNRTDEEVRPYRLLYKIS